MNYVCTYVLGCFPSPMHPLYHAASLSCSPLFHAPSLNDPTHPPLFHAALSSTHPLSMTPLTHPSSVQPSLTHTLSQ